MYVAAEVGALGLGQSGAVYAPAEAGALDLGALGLGAELGRAWRGGAVSFAAIKSTPSGICDETPRGLFLHFF